MLKQDILRSYNLSSGGHLKKIIDCYRAPGVHAVVVFRFGQWLSKQHIGFKLLLMPLYFFLEHRIRSKWGIEIARSTEIGAGLYIGHFGGIHISPEAKIGKNLSISQQVSIGVSGQGEKQGVPTIGDNVYIAPGAKLFGKIKIGNNVKIGANVVVYQDIPDDAIVVADQGLRIISYKGNQPKQAPELKAAA